MLVRQLFYVATTLVVYGLECAFGVQILGVLSRPQPDTIYSLAYVLLAVVAIGLSRAWQLLGAPHRGFLAWLSPLQPEGTPTNALPVRSASSQKNEKATN